MRVMLKVTVSKELTRRRLCHLIADPQQSESRAMRTGRDATQAFRTRMIDRVHAGHYGEAARRANVAGCLFAAKYVARGSAGSGGTRACPGRVVTPTSFPVARHVAAGIARIT